MKAKIVSLTCGASRSHVGSSSNTHEHIARAARVLPAAKLSIATSAVIKLAPLIRHLQPSRAGRDYATEMANALADAYQRA